MRLTTTRIQSQNPVFSLSLEKSIAMLLLPHAELSANIEEELQNNPLLEAEYALPPADQSKEIQDLQIDLDRINALTVTEDKEFESPSVTKIMTLEDLLFQQLFWEISDPVKRKIGNFIIGNLDQDGFLHLTCEEIAEALNILNVSIIKEVLN